MRGGKRIGAGRPTGSKNKATEALRARIADEGDPVGVLIAAARGDNHNNKEPSWSERIVAAKWLGDRILAPSRQPTLSVLESADLSTPGSIAVEIMRAVAAGEVDPREALWLVKALASALTLEENRRSKTLATAFFLSKILQWKNW